MKRLLLVLMLILGAVMITSRPVATYAYTDEEKQQAKSWLSSHGYPPTRAGAEQAYQDYMDGKIDVPEADAYMGKNQKNDIEEKEKSKAGGILALLFCVAIGVCSEYSTEIEQFCMKIYREYFAEKGSLSGLKHTDEITYTEKKDVGGRMLTFGLLMSSIRMTKNFW